MTAEEVLEQVLADREFYVTSGGGVTLSGGEPLFQRDFACRILDLCRKQGLHTAIESNMLWPWEHVRPVLELTDLVMMDIKFIDDEKHKRWTGASNQRVLDNALRLGSGERPLIVRTPVIPGMNDDPQEIGRIADFLAQLEHLEYYELLPYHPLATGKYQSLAMSYETAGLKRPPKQVMRDLAAEARRRGIPVRTADDHAPEGSLAPSI